MAQEQAAQRGYLNEEFRLFHLRDGAMKPVDWHYHDFHKILVFLGGHAAYAIEGQNYALEPGDMVLVPRGAIHKPEIQPGMAYQRYVLYLSPSLLKRAASEETDLELCFRQASRDYSYVLRPERAEDAVRLLEALSQALREDAYGRDLLCRALLVQFLVSVSRNMDGHHLRYVSSAACDEKIVGILKYLNLHIGESFSIDDLSRQFYMSKYYMMRRFKAETGHTIHGYLTEKRLLLAREKIAAGEALSRVSEDCGFGDYSTFSRAYKKRFGVSPNAPVSRIPTVMPDKALD